MWLTTRISNCVDRKVDMFPAPAETAEADPIVSSDPQQINLYPWHGIALLLPATFLVGIR